MKPAYRVTIDGRDVTSKWGAVLEALTITDEAGIKADTLQVSFDAREGLTSPPIGAEVKVWLGYEPEPVYMGAYRVDGWTKSGPQRRLEISARAADLTSEIRAPRLAGHHETTVGEIVRKIAERHGLTPIVDAKIGARPIDHIDQQNESDIGFLSRLARRQGATFKVADGKVIFAAKGSKAKPGGGAKSAIVITPPDAAIWSMTADERGGYRSASAMWFDRGAGKRRRYRTGSATPHHRDGRLYGSEEEARAAAEANLGDLGRGKLNASLGGPGNPSIYAEALVRLEGFDPDVDGEYFAKSIRHSLTGGGYTTDMDLETGGDNETDPIDE